MTKSMSDSNNPCDGYRKLSASEAIEVRILAKTLRRNCVPIATADRAADLLEKMADMLS